MKTNADQSQVYHYTKADSLFNILDTLTLKLGTFEKVNDPKESKDWHFKFFCLQSESKKLFDHGLFKKISSFILSRSHILCLSTDNAIANPDDIDLLTKGYSCPRMWAQYGGGHAGACLIFDKGQLAADFDSFFSGMLKFKGEVEYLNTVYGPRINDSSGPQGIFYEHLLSLGFNNYMYSHIIKFYKYLYFFKHFNWRDENEFRFVIISKDEHAEYALPIRNALKKVIITEDFPKSRLPELIERCQNLKVPLERLMWRGWAMHLMPTDDDQEENRETISFNGISYPIDFQYDLLYTQACDSRGRMRTILFDFKDGGKVIVVN